MYLIRAHASAGKCRCSIIHIKMYFIQSCDNIIRDILYLYACVQILASVENINSPIAISLVRVLKMNVLNMYIN